MRNICAYALSLSLMAACAAYVPSANAANEAPHIAFPGATGFGGTTPGGRGGKVLLVTNLRDSGPGSLREAVDTDGPRVVLFRVSGTIELKKDLDIVHPYITIWGQTAPGDGICLKDHPLKINGTHDVIVQFLRVRPGIAANKEMDSLSVKDSKNVIIANCSTSWSIDETLSVTGDSDLITVQQCIISEALNDSIHKKGKHGYGSLLVAQNGRFTFFTNLYAHNNSRNPRPGSKEGMPGLTLDFRNNIIYDWGDRAGYSSLTPIKVNYVGNFLRRGPSTSPARPGEAFHVGGAATHLYLSGNVMEGFKEETADNWKMVTYEEAMTPEQRAQVRSDTPFDSVLERTLPCPDFVEETLNVVGAFLPARDKVDHRVVESVRKGTGKIIDTTDEVGGWPELKGKPAPTDEDNDGMADAWEQQYGMNPADASDPTLDPDGDGYTNIEEYVYGLNPIAGKQKS